MTFYLFIDDIRSPHWMECQLSGVDADLDWVIVRTSEEAKAAVLERGRLPDRMALDHDLGHIKIQNGDDFHLEVDETPIFLKWLANEFWNGSDKVPEYTIHSANPVGVQRMRSFMESWKKSASM